MADICYSIDSISINYGACWESLHHFVVPLPLTREAWVVSVRRFNKGGWGGVSGRCTLTREALVVSGHRFNKGGY
jgi:hypothetical protein